MSGQPNLGVASQLSPWDNTAQNTLVIDCQIDGENLASLTCWNLKINMLISIIFIVPFIHQLRLFYSYYDGHLFGSRQRITYICLITTILLTITYSITNVEALYSITSFFLQILFFQFMGYLITKTSKLTSSWISIIMYILNGGILSALLVYLFLSLVYDDNDKTHLKCYGFLDRTYSQLRMAILGSWILLYCFCGTFLKTLLTRDSDFIVHFEEKQKKDKEIFKLRTTTAVIILAEAAQLVFIFFNSEYYSERSETCPLPNINDGYIKDNIILFCYRLLTIYLPLTSLLWMTWISSKDVEIKFSDPFSDSGVETNSRFASGLSYNGTGFRSKSTMNTYYSTIDEEDDN